MSLHTYRDGSTWVAVSIGLDNETARIGLGQSAAEARSDLQDTAIQCGGPAPVQNALHWAHNAGWIGHPDTLRKAAK